MENNMEKGNFEHSWKTVFEGAEEAPSNAVWANVELGLEKDVIERMKESVLFYKWLAAASLVFAMAFAGTYYFNVIDSESPGIGQTEGINPDEVAPGNHNSTEQINEAKENDNGNSDSGNHGSNEKVIKNSIAPSKSENLTSRLVAKMESDRNLLLAPLVGNAHEEFFGLFLNKPKSELVNLKNPKLIIPSNESTADPGLVLLARLKDEEDKSAEKEKKTSTENIWTSVGFSAGSFNPNTPNATTVYQSTSNSYSTYSSDPASGSSYSFGVQVGGKIAARLMLLGGISYLTQNASYTSITGSVEAAVVKASLNDFAYNDPLGYVNTSPYGVNSNLQYISLPVQAGYVVLDRKFAIQLNGGLSTDFFILNTLTPDEDNIDQVSRGPGDESPFRPVNFSGLVGTEFSYKFSDRYRLAVNPGIKYALNSIYKDDISVQASPITYDVALRFRYIFK